jgi:hypothetical protein
LTAGSFGGRPISDPPPATPFSIAFGKPPVQRSRQQSQVWKAYAKLRKLEDKLQIESGARIVAVADQVSCDLAGEAAILNLKNGVYYGLNSVGAFIWNLVQQPKSIDEVKTAVLKEYDVDATQCEADLLLLLADLKENGLIEVS